MGFSSSLQSSSEALLSRQDAEIRLLEAMKRSVVLRAKADREYAAALSAAAAHAGAATATDVLSGSLVLRAWTVFAEETERQSRIAKENAECLSASTTDKISALHSEKKQNRRQYAEENARIAQELARLQEAVARTRADYERCLEAHAAARAKFEATAGSRKEEESRERYAKACRRLHTAHNEYVLLLCEASEFERDMRTILLPGILEHQQALHEDMVEKWKIILQVSKFPSSLYVPSMLLAFTLYNQTNLLFHAMTTVISFLRCLKD
jgi:tyrosine-protein kinase Fer